LAVSSTTVIPNLNADMVDGIHSSTIVQDGAVMMNTNPFGGRNLYINSIDNAMYAADKKWYVTTTKHLVSYGGETYPKLKDFIFVNKYDNETIDFANPEAVTINLFAVPSINWQDHTVLVQNTIEMIEEERTDSMYIIDTPDSSLTLEIGESKPDVVASVDIASSLNDTGIDTSFACTYSPWIQIKDTQNNVNLYVSPTGEVVKAIAYNDRVKAPWYAPAGLNRGVTGAKKSKYKLSQDARHVLQKARINPMVDYAEVGTAILGQKTLEIKESALNSINIRRLLLQVKVLISNIAIRILFEPNDQTAIDEFINKVNPILEKIKRERGLFEFAVKMDDTLNTPESIDRNELYGEIYLKPTRTIEKIGIGFTISPTGASFRDL
jgi:hypothetical protein